MGFAFGQFLEDAQMCYCGVEVAGCIGCQRCGGKGGDGVA